MPRLDLDELHRRYLEQLPTICAMLLPEGTYDNPEVFKETAHQALFVVDAIMEVLQEDEEEEEDG